MSAHPLPQTAAARRARLAATGPAGDGPVVYWMHREHRAADNWGLTLAAQTALDANRALVVAYCLAPSFLEAGPGHYHFLREGLRQTAAAIENAGARFCLCLGDPAQEIPKLCTALRPLVIFTDFDPLRLKRHWLSCLSLCQAAAVYEVDSRNVIPCWLASNKSEYMARTIRPKIHRLLPDFLDACPPLARLPLPASGLRLPEAIVVDHRQTLAGSPAPGIMRPAKPQALPGEQAALDALERFVAQGLADYDTARNDPAKDGQSGLSPYLHFGQLSAARIVRRVQEAAHAPDVSRQAFVEELVVRRELSDNFCLHHPDYDAPTAFPQWAQNTLAKHAADPRPVVYSQQTLEQAATADPLWNAAQQEMVVTGRMHGYLRMYWAKKLLEWSEDAASAQAVAIRFNDAYQLDGRETNGYAGIAWSIGGIHDRPWGERAVFGSVRFMSYKGAASKFSIMGYIERVESLTQEKVQARSDALHLAKRPRL